MVLCVFGLNEVDYTYMYRICKEPDWGSSSPPILLYIRVPCFSVYVCQASALWASRDSISASHPTHHKHWDYRCSFPSPAFTCLLEIWTQIPIRVCQELYALVTSPDPCIYFSVISFSSRHMPATLKRVVPTIQLIWTFVCFESSVSKPNSHEP